MTHFYFVVYIAGHLFAFAGPMPDEKMCEMARQGFNEGHTVPATVHPYCDVRAVVPTIGEIENDD